MLMDIIYNHHKTFFRQKVKIYETSLHLESLAQLRLTLPKDLLADLLNLSNKFYQ